MTQACQKEFEDICIDFLKIIMDHQRKSRYQGEYEKQMKKEICIKGNRPPWHEVVFTRIWSKNTFTYIWEMFKKSKKNRLLHICRV